MRRRHLFELEDQPWLPRVLRDGVTDFLEFAVVHGDLYRNVRPRLLHALEASGETEVLDLCAGGGGAWLRLYPHLPQSVHVVRLSDFYPNLTAFERCKRRSGGRIDYAAEPVDARMVGSARSGFRTLFSSFHHFRPSDALSILRDAVESRAPIAILESTQRHPLVILYMLITPLLVWLATPFLRPLSLSRLVFTYLLPVIPLVVAFDGIVSCLRTYTVPELEDMVASLGEQGYDWQIGVERHRGLPVGVTYLIGVPRAPRSSG